MKDGAGCLALGGAAQFSNDGSGPGGAPAATSNRLVVAEGSLKVCSTNAIDGVQVELASGVPLVLDVAPAADGMAEYGAVSTKWGTPFVLADGALKIAFDDASGFLASNPGNFRVAICTLPAATAEGLDVSVGRIPFYKLRSFERRSNGDGTVTLVAGFSRRSTVMIIR